MLGTVWKTRWGIALLLALWSAGMLTGALHPLGVLAALALLISALWFVAALGIRASLVSRDVCARDGSDDHAAHPVDRHLRAL